MKKLIEQALSELEGKILQTPIEFSAKLSELLGQPTYLKLENLQITGSFKVRGALFYLSELNTAAESKGVAACSAGNHGLGVAYAAQKLKIPCTIFVPKNVDEAKYEKLIRLGAKVLKSEFIGYDDTLAWAEVQAKNLGFEMIPAFDDEKIMAANGGTLAAEIARQVPQAQHFVVPVGGGGLAAGFSWYIKDTNPNAEMTMCQIAACPALQLSLAQGKAMTTMPAATTIAGGLEGGLGEKCFDILKSRVDQIVLIDEDEIGSAMRWLLAHHQYLIEPSAAVTLAACLSGKVKPTQPTVIVLTGRNVAYSTLKNVICKEI